jgi:transposase
MDLRELSNIAQPKRIFGLSSVQQTQSRKMQKRHLLDHPLNAVEIETLEEMAKHHRFGDFRLRALGLLALNEGQRVVDICNILRVSDQPVYNWAKGWRELGLVGILDGHKGGAPVKLTAPMLDMAAQIATKESLTLGKIAARLRDDFPDAPSFSLDRLSKGLKARGMSFKRTRLSLKKT